MNEKTINALLASIRLEEAVALSYLMLRVINGCLNWEMAEAHAEEFGTSPKVLKTAIKRIGADSFTTSDTEAKRMAEEVDKALSNLTMSATRHSAERANRLLVSLRHIPISLV